MDTLRSWIWGLISASIVAAAAQQLTPEGPVKQVTRFACGVMLCGMLLLPVAGADRGVFSLSLSDYRRTVTALTEDLEQQEKELLRAYIEERSAAYILDEAQVLGIKDLRAAVLAKWGDESWMPYEVTLKGVVTPEQRRRLSRFLDGELGIPEERQFWDVE